MASRSVAHGETVAAFIPELERLIAEAMEEWKVPGLTIAVVQNGEVALVRAYGLRDVEAGLKLTTDTQFLIGSITKSFTATGLALLMDERRMDWRKPVREYIPEFRLHDAVATDRVTVRDLLCHHSGLPRHDWIWLPGDLSPAKMLAAMRYFEPSDDIRNTRTNWPYTIFVIMPINGRLMDTPRRSPRLKRAACSSDGVLFMLVEVLLAS